MKNLERVLGFVFLAALLVVGKSMLASEMLFFRLIVGLGLGYSLARGYTGFAGSVNRAVSNGSTKLMRALMFMFFISSIVVAAFMFGDAGEGTYNLWVNPINFGLILGAGVFGFGMSMSQCCATGVLTDLSSGFTRAIITLFFFMFANFLAMPIQKTATWVTQSWFSTGDYRGVYFPDLFKWDGLNGYLGALVLTGLIALAVVAVSYLYEKRRKAEGTYQVVPAELKDEANDLVKVEDFDVVSEDTYNRLFVKPWKLKTAMGMIAVLFTVLFAVTKGGWGASGPMGIWFGKILMLFGASAESLEAFTQTAAASFEAPFFANAVNVQNTGIALGAVVYLLTAGIFKTTFMSELKITPKQGALYALGGFAMGAGARLANGCNVGGMYTPIASFSLAGWLFLLFMLLGGILGGKFNKAISNE